MWFSLVLPCLGLELINACLFSEFGKLLAILSSNMFSDPTSFFSPSRTPVRYNLDFRIFSHRSPGLCVFFFQFSN